MLAVLTVSVNFDGTNSTNDGNLTLREAIAYVNVDDQPQAGDLVHIDLTEPFGTNDTILFAPGLSGQTIDLNSELNITEAVTIDASMLSQKITIDAGHGTDAMPFDGTGFRVFNINISAVGTDVTKEVALIGLTITGGDVFARPNGTGVFGGYTPQFAEYALAV